MHSTSLRKVGGSVMLAVPPALLDMMRVRAGSRVGIAVEDGKLIVKPQSRQRRARYTLEELIAQCSPRKTARRSKADAAWTAGMAAGRELI